jgi:hypothetical protein
MDLPIVWMGGRQEWRINGKEFIEEEYMVKITLIKRALVGY